MPEPTKKTKKKKKKKGKKVNKLIDIPTFLDPILRCPMAKLCMYLAVPSKANQHLKFNLNVPITSRIEYISQKIIEMYQGTISNVSICINKTYNSNDALSPTTTLEQLGITKDQEVDMIYDFTPISHPLLYA